jgi:glycosyltransferase involved in cell wall biosynthesis
MNILMLNYEYPPLGRGAGRVAYHQVKEFSKTHYIIVVTTAWKDSVRVEKSENIEIHRLPSTRKKKHQSSIFEMMSWISYAWQFCLNYIEENPVDIIFAHFTIPGGVVAYRLQKKFNIPYVVMSHGHDIPWFFPRKMWLYHLLSYYKIKRICRSASRLFLLTPQLKEVADDFVGELFAHKNIVIPNACDSELFKFAENKQFEKFSLVFVGRLVAQKNPMLFLKSLYLLHLEEIEFHATIIGDGPLYGKLKEMIQRYGLSKKIQLVGWKDSEYIIHALATSHLFVLPSRAEAMSMSVLEALYSGIFIITTPEADSYELIENGKNGFIIKNMTEEKLADEMTVFYEKYFWIKQEVDRNLVEKIRNTYNWKNVGSLYIEEIDAVLDNQSTD